MFTEQVGWTEVLDDDAAHLYLLLQCMGRVDQYRWLVLVWVYLPLNALAAAKRSAFWLVARTMSPSAHIVVCILWILVLESTIQAPANANL